MVIRFFRFLKNYKIFSGVNYFFIFTLILQKKKKKLISLFFVSFFSQFFVFLLLLFLVSFRYFVSLRFTTPEPRIIYKLTFRNYIITAPEGKQIDTTEAEYLFQYASS